MTPKTKISISDLLIETGITLKLIELAGEFNDDSIKEHSKLIYHIIDNAEGTDYYIFHLRDLQDLNTKALEYLHDWCHRILANEGQIKFAEANENILNILDTVGLTSFIEHYPSLEDATNAFRAREMV